MASERKKNEVMPFVLMAGFALGLLLLAAGFALIASGSAPSIGNGCVGVIEVTGPIVVDDSPASLFDTGASGSETIAREIEDASKRQDVKALVVFIDSPGGSPVASRQIWSALEEFGKPKVAYMREMAASGGYYVAAGTDYIVAEPGTITGSIGVRATFTDLTGLFEKIGYNETVFKSGRFKDIGSSSREMSDEEVVIMQGIVDELFGEFRGIVMQSRGSRLDASRMDEIFDARIMTGRQALSYGLVDELGDKRAAVRKAAQMAGDESLQSCELGAAKKGFLSTLAGEFSIFPSPSALVSKWILRY